MYDPKESSSLAFDELGLEVPFAELPPAAGKPAPAAEHFAFAESPFAELEEPETESLAWHDLEADEQESAWRDEGGGEGEWLEEDQEEEHCPHCGSRAELEAEEFTEECEHGHESDESDTALGESWLEREWDPENEDEIDFEEESKDLTPANVPDQSLAQTPFSPEVRARLEEPLPEAKLVRGAMQWNTASHPAISEIDAATLLAQLEIYVDRAGIVQAMQNKADLRELATDPGAVLAVMAQQFQCKIFAPPPPPPPAPRVNPASKKKKKANDPRDGLLGEGTLDALGFVRHRGTRFNIVDQANVNFYVKSNSVAFRRLGETYKLDPALFKALGEDVKPENWYYLFANPPFLGQTFQSGVHIELIRRLRMGERWLLSQPQYSLLSPAQLGAALSIDEPHKGGRQKDLNSASMHILGLAVDIGYIKNPWVAGQSKNENRNDKFKKITKHAAQLLAGKDEELTPKWLASLGNADGGTTEAAFSAILQRHKQLLEYLRLETDRQGLLAAIEQRRKDGGTIARTVMKSNQTIEHAANSWAEQIRNDQKDLKDVLGGRRTSRGFLNLDRDLVIALRDKGQLAWGAIDLGTTESGDMMHFDCRPTGLGLALAIEKQRTTGTNHPCWTPPPQQSKPATKKRKIPSKSKESETQDFEQGEWNETSWETDDEFDSADDSPKQPSLVELARIAKSRALKKSRGLCFRWVKLALKQSGLVDIYLPGVAAKNAGYELTKHGFSNVITSNNYSINSPYDAPVGAVLVYDKTSDAKDKNAKYGHIEIRTVDGFASDYFSKNARTGDARSGLSGRGRRLIGVYIKVPNQDSEYFAYDENEGEWIDEQSLNFDRQTAPALPAPTLKPCEQQILDLVAKSELPRSGWKDSSRAPLGYLNGMALTFARVYCKFKRGDWYAQQMARAPKPGTQATDALAHLAQRFRRSRMSVSVDGAVTLRHLFVMLFGLGMRESGGKFFVGVDRSAEHTNRSEIEAGLFQMSHSIGVANPARVALHGIYELLRMIPYDGYLGTFAQGLRLQGKTLTDNEPSAVGLFRNFCLTQPALSAELAAMGARVRRKHWGPINRQTVELLPKCNALLKEIQALVDSGFACDCFLPVGWQPASEPVPAPAPPNEPARHSRTRESEYSDEEFDAWGEDFEDNESAAADHLDEYEGEDQEAWEAVTDLEAEFEGDFESGDLQEWEDVSSADMENRKPRTQAPSRQSAILRGKNWTFRSQALSADIELYVPTAAINRAHDVELLVYVHGLLHVCYKGIRAVPQLLAPMTEPGLGQIVESSGRPLVLVVPRLQSQMKNGSWRARGLEKPATFNAVMADVRHEIAQKFNRSAPDISRLVLAGHSRAYGVLHPLITSHTSPEMDRGALAKLTHIWPIDTTYRIYSPRFPKPEAKQWLARRPSLVLHISYNPKSATNDFREYCPPQRMILNPVCGEHCELQGPVLSMLISTLPTLATSGIPVVKPELEQFDDEDWIVRNEAWHAPAALESGNLDPETEGWDGEFDPEEEEDEAAHYLEDHELDPALTSLAERVMSREDPHFELDIPKRWTRCFAQATIDKLVQGYKDNQAAADANRIDRNSCIVMLNVGLGQLLDIILKESRARGVSDRRVRMANLPTESIQAAMKTLQKGGYALPPKRFEFYDRRKHTAGTLKPETLKLSVLQHVLALSKAEGCWFAFGLSILDGYHSVLLLVHRRPDGAKVYWLDQFSAGLTVDVTSTLDDVLTEKTKTFWQGVMDSKTKGYNTTIQLWALRRKSR